MRIPQRGLIAVIAAGIVAFSGGLQGQVDDSGRGYSVQDWPFVGGDWTSSRYSTLTDITTDTVDRLGAAWVTRLPGGGASRATPVIKDGVMYLTAGASVLAIDARTGETVWRWQASNPEAGMVPTWQGVGLGAGFVFVGLGSAQVAALRQDTGELVWVESVGSVPEHYGESVTTAPLYAGGKVFVGLASGDSGGQGRIIALEAATGETQWTFYIVPRPGEFGHDTWPQDSDHWKLGGGGVWLNGAADPDLGMVYFVTGNPVPMYGGELRKGDNLFTAAVLALDMDTGERRWHYQVVRHDLWDADIAIPPLLYDTEIDGQARKALAAIRADGYMFLFDRETGEPLTPIEERPVSQDASLFTAPTQPYPAGVEKIVPDCSYWRDRVPPPFELSCDEYTPPSLNQHTLVAPGSPIPMVRVTPMSFSPQTGYIYAQGRGHVGRIRRFEDPWISDNRGSGYVRIGLPESTGVLAAVDGRTNTIAWKQQFRGARLATSGPMTTAGGLMFWASADGQFEAYDARTGDRVWRFQIAPPGARQRPGSPSSYAVDGQQFIAIPNGNQLWAFALDGTVSPVAGEYTEIDDLVRWIGPPARETDIIEVATLVENPSWSTGGRRNALDEHAFNPLRAQVTAGTRVRFLNNGEMAHTVEARDGSWTAGVIEPGLSSYVTLDQPGTFLYHCPDHPWAIGEITVVP